MTPKYIADYFPDQQKSAFYFWYCTPQITQICDETGKSANDCDKLFVKL